MPTCTLQSLECERNKVKTPLNSKTSKLNMWSCIFYMGKLNNVSQIKMHLGENGSGKHMFQCQQRKTTFFSLCKYHLGTVYMWVKRRCMCSEIIFTTGGKIELSPFFFR